MNIKLFDSELKLMEMLWENEPITAKELCDIASEKIGWNKNTTYTVIKKLVAKGAVLRSEPGFICKSLIARENVVKNELSSLVKKLCKGSKKALFSALIDDELSGEEIAELRKMLDEKL